MARIFSFRAPINVSQARVGTTVGEPGGDAGTDASGNKVYPMAGPVTEPMTKRAAVTLGGNAYPIEVSAATIGGGVVGLFFGGWLWGAIGAAGVNLAGRFGASAYCKQNPDVGKPGGDDAYGKCGRSRPGWT